ncbi:MAG: DUF1549 domain-containing protein, partial [Planctomycetaceae bacterium]|nr:DUF1549 domain-containing protein [Planctomycetaceae bacterium]
MGGYLQSHPPEGICMEECRLVRWSVENKSCANPEDPMITLPNTVRNAWFLPRTFHTSVLLFTFSVATAGVTSGAEQAINFSRDILPILSNKCFVCHGPDAAEIGAEMLRLDSPEAAQADRGGYRAIDPTVPAQSRMLTRLHSTDDPMPPADAEKQLTASERDLLTQWIHGGGQYTRHWAFVPPEKPAVPGQPAATGRDAVDAFIHRRLSERHLDFAPEADRRTLVRRVSLMLTGLPPEPDLVERFLHDGRPDAYERLVDQILASPAFGEHQARYWLDAIRYGDTHGLHLDNRRGIYPYRDWVVRAFNQNLPLNDFITWQVAGDLLPDPSLEQLVATGFVRMNPTTAEGGAIPEEFQAKNNFDRVETLGTVLLGMSLTCARCHTHKYDPIPQQEYYELLAFFNSTAEHSMDGNKYEYAPVIKAPADQQAWETYDAMSLQRAELIQQADGLLSRLPGLTPEIMASWKSGDATAKLRMLADTTSPLAALPVHTEALLLHEDFATAEEQYTTTLVAQELPQPRETRLLRRGEYNLPTGDPLQPDVLSVMGELPAGAPRNRLGLARWLTSRSHPLVARVLVNRIWQQFFGTGLVKTTEDFGIQSEFPEYPDLLDWLAADFRDHDWDIKHLVRRIVTSHTYRQSSAVQDSGKTDSDGQPVSLNEIDPENRLLARGARYRRPSWMLRDQALVVSGLLNRTVGGPPVNTYQPDGVWEEATFGKKTYQRDTGEAVYRRSLYVFWRRIIAPTMFFDVASRQSCSVRAVRTNTPLHALLTLNETTYVECSRVLAEQLLTDPQLTDDAARIRT